jgi:hypothetical protein
MFTLYTYRHRPHPTRRLPTAARCDTLDQGHGCTDEAHDPTEIA